MSSERARAMAIALAMALAGCRTAAQSARPAECAMAPGDELVDVRRLDRSIRTEIRYATANNFTGRRLPGYEKPRAMLRPSAAAALVRVQQRLRTEGLGLKIFDAYRPVRATLAMVGWAERTGNRWVLDQGYVARQSGHNLGITVDLTLVDLRTGRELAMGTPFDTFSEAAHTANATGTIMENRMRLKRAMEAEGFQNYEKEWWHYRLAGDATPLDVPLRCFP
ncbi:MAG: D-alanyl-D-alanine carboxypeptidase family protein [Gemmatimonadetes bacterium]|nr:D-alanyl-D-alanine carboxypeptidase family protein [Gemmatimonadota bacterium]